MNPACRAKIAIPKYEYWGEAICKPCWKKIPTWMTYNFRYQKREWKRMEKEILMGSDKYIPYYERQFRYAAFALALNWQKIRFHFEVKPEFPAGLVSHLREVFSDYGPYQPAHPTLIPGFRIDDRRTWGIE